MTNINLNTLKQEQIKNESTKSVIFYKKLKTFLEKDEYGFFKTKVKRTLESKLQDSESTIQNLLDLKLRSEKTFKALVDKRKNLKNQNKKLKESLISHLGIQKNENN